MSPPSNATRQALHLAPPINQPRQESDIVEKKAKAMLIMAATLGALVLAGFVGAFSYNDETTVGHYQNDRANHHPRHLTN
jgi:hypothetical protein